MCLCVYIAAFIVAVFIFVNCKMRYLQEHGYTRHNLTPVEMRQLDLALNITLDGIRDMTYDRDEFYALTYTTVKSGGMSCRRVLIRRILWRNST